MGNWRFENNEDGTNIDLSIDKNRSFNIAISSSSGRSIDIGKWEYNKNTNTIKLIFENPSSFWEKYMLDENLKEKGYARNLVSYSAVDKYLEIQIRYLPDVAWVTCNEKRYNIDLLNNILYKK